MGRWTQWTRLARWLLAASRLCRWRWRIDWTAARPLVWRDAAMVALTVALFAAIVMPACQQAWGEEGASEELLYALKDLPPETQSLLIRLSTSDGADWTDPKVLMAGITIILGFAMNVLVFVAKFSRMEARQEAMLEDIRQIQSTCRSRRTC